MRDVWAGTISKVPLLGGMFCKYSDNLEIARQRFGTSSERSARLEQLELTLTELQETAVEAEAAGRAVEHSPTVRRIAAPRKPPRRPLPEHLPRTRVVYPAPSACPCCGGAGVMKTMVSGTA